MGVIWKPVLQQYRTQEASGTQRHPDVDPEKLGYLLVAEVPGGALLKLVGPSGLSITFVPDKVDAHETRTHSLNFLLDTGGHDDEAERQGDRALAWGGSAHAREKLEHESEP